MLNKKRVIFVKLKSSRQTNLEIKIKGDFTMANTIFPIFLKDSNNRTFDEIQAAHRKNQLFATDSKLNVLLGSVLATDRSELTLTVINMKAFLADLGYDQKSMHILPSNDKGDITKKILLSVQHFVAKNFPTRSIKGILFYADEEKPIAHIFFQQKQKQKPQDSNVPVNTYELTPAKASRSHLNNKKESKPEEPSDLRSNYQQKQKDHDHALRLQHQAMSQQAKATDKEEPSNSRSNYQQKQRDHDHALHLQHQAMNQQAKATDKKEPSNSRSNYQQKQRDHDHALHLQHQAMSQQTKATDKEEEKKSQRHKHQEHHYTYQQPTWWPKDDGLTR